MITTRKSRRGLLDDMADTIKVPIAGPVNKKLVIAGGFGIAGILAYAWWMRGSAPTGSAEEPATDQLEYVPDGFSGATVPGGSTVDRTDTSDTIDTNPEWAQRVVEMLESVGYERQFVANTISKWFSGEHLTASEVLLVQAAKGLLGPPPSGDIPILKIGTPPTQPPPAGSAYVGNLHAGFNILGGPIVTTNAISLRDVARYALPTGTHQDTVTVYYRAIVAANPKFKGDPKAATRVGRGTQIILPPFPGVRLIA